ncbi:MAG: permease-like cell division protein FtsX [Oscillospiraceae bacterium]|jgi:cell division transport system permease protein|nr:permease-like cell division protein FtsX [Oscillospiraceae bacterium]
MHTLSKIGYYLKEGIAGVLIHGFLSFASVFIISACLLIMGCFALVAINIDHIIDEYENENKVVAFVDENLTEEEAIALEAEIEASANVRDAEYFSREDAYSRFLNTFADSDMARMFSAISPSTFRSRYTISLDDLVLTEDTIYGLATITGIVQVNAHLDISRGFVTVRNVVGIVSIALVIILFVVSVFMMTNTVKLTTFSRREEIGIMRMVGATSMFIRWPFIVEGLILGLLGSAIAFCVQWGLYQFASQWAETFSFSIGLLPFGLVALPLIAIFGGVGILIGVGGSVTAIKNYLKV